MVLEYKRCHSSFHLANICATIDTIEAENNCCDSYPYRQCLNATIMCPSQLIGEFGKAHAEDAKKYKCSN